MAGGGVPGRARGTGGGRDGGHETSGAGSGTEPEKGVGSGGPATDGGRTADLHGEHESDGGGAATGDVTVRAMVPGKLLQIHAATLWFGCTCGVWDASYA